MYLVSLMFGIQSLSFDPREDLETFSGCMSITRAEWEVGCGVQNPERRSKGLMNYFTG